MSENVLKLDRATIYNRWLEFSLNLADVYDISQARKEKLKEAVKEFIMMYNTEGYVDKPIMGWGAFVKGDIDIGTHAEEFFDEYETHRKSGDIKEGSFYNQILSCIRAGLDVAVPDMCGGGVIGFTVGDIRAAYSYNIPQWLNEVLELTGDEPEGEHIWL